MHVAPKRVVATSVPISNAPTLVLMLKGGIGFGKNEGGMEVDKENRIFLKIWTQVIEKRRLLPWTSNYTFRNKTVNSLDTELKMPQFLLTTKSLTHVRVVRPGISEREQSYF